MSDKIEEILYMALGKGKDFYDAVLSVSKGLPKSKYPEMGDKLEKAYSIVEQQREKGYENKHLDKKQRRKNRHKNKK